MSKAFTKEDSGDEAPVVAPRAPLPEGVANYVTPRGLELLRAEKRTLEAARVALRDAPDATMRLAGLSQRLFELEQRLASAECVEPLAEVPSVVRFGSQVTLKDDAEREQRYQIVGVDEAEPSAGRIAFLSPVARALLGAEVGDRVRLERPGPVRELEVLKIE
jgi:transcription elongation factor GreB